MRMLRENLGSAIGVGATICSAVELAGVAQVLPSALPIGDIEGVIGLWTRCGTGATGVWGLTRVAHGVLGVTGEA
jgi:hypothetical protein